LVADLNAIDGVRIVRRFLRFKQAIRVVREVSQRYRHTVADLCGETPYSAILDRAKPLYRNELWLRLTTLLISPGRA
jgi:hypothetical protein